MTPDTRDGADIRPALNVTSPGFAFALAGAATLLLVVITPLTALQQAALGAVLVIAAAAASYARSDLARVLVAVLATVASTRYLFWRLTETLDFSSWTAAVLGYGLLVAELYLWVVLIFSFVSTLPTRRRQPTPLPADHSQWPTVDVYIPTYNEDLSIVRTTVLAARDLNYPVDKFKVYILDDGRRPEFRDFAEEAGVEYITRADNQHAKAGNINNALKQSDGDLIAIFDCDHVPTAGFLQKTVGSFVANKNLGVLQTPHYFYNQDSFEKNLRDGDSVPNEGLLFYGLIQDGNDFWNACFFCGSCAVLRREALEEVGGVAVETVTEDAHTSLKMQRRGWDTAYLRYPLAAGLATESLGVHIGQRMRWARGMLQIFRLDNPLFGPGLTLPQRICYANAMIHFMFPLPRFILLTAPLAYLLLGERVIESDAWTVLAYGLPHLAVATISSMVVQGRFRHPLWGEFHETALSLHLIRPTLMTLLRPREGKFNVTQKSSGGGEVRFDWGIVRWHLALLTVLVAALGYGVVAMAAFNLPTDDLATTALNVFWGSVSVAFVLVTIAVGVNRPGLGERSLAPAALNAVVYAADGRAVAAQTTRLSTREAVCTLPTELTADVEGVELRSDDGAYAYAPARTAEASGRTARLALRPEDLRQERAIASVVLGRHSAWANWDAWRHGTFFGSLKGAGAAIGGLWSWVADTVRRSPRAQVRAGLLTVVLVAMTMALVARGAQAQTLSPSPKPFAMHTSDAAPITEHRSLTLSLRDFGVLSPLRMQGSSNTRGVGFTLRSDEVVVSARFAIRVAYSPNLDPANSQITVSLNGETVHAAALDPLDGTLAVIEFDVNPYLFLPDNNLVFELRARRLGDDTVCEDDGMVWAQVSNTSQMFLTVGRLTSPPDLAYLPRPFFDPRDATELTLPFVFSKRPSAQTIKAASVVASYWGVESHYRGASFPVHFDHVPPGDAVVFATPEEAVAALGPDAPALQDIAGPTISVVANPNDDRSRLLLIMGRNGEELNEAARALSLGSQVFNRQTALVSAPMVEKRRAYDAPRWIPTDRPVRLGELATPQELEGRGVTPGTLGVNFLTAPDFFAWGGAEATLDVRYRAPGEQWIDVKRSRLDVLVNDKFVETLSLAADRRFSFAGASAGSPSSGVEVAIPPYLLFGQSQLQFYFDLHTRDADSCAVPPGELRSAVDLDSVIDLSQIHRFTEMPNLAFLAQSGFPFTKHADLSETAVILSPDFRGEDLEALLRVMGLFGARTGYPATRVEILFPGDVAQAEDKDILLLGAFDAQPLFRDWQEASPLRFTGDIAEIRVRRSPDRALGRFVSLWGEARTEPQRVSVPMRALSSLMTSFESPMTQGRTVVAMMASTRPGLVELADAMRDAETAPDVQGDLITLSGGEIESYMVADRYHVGSLPPFTHVRWWMSQNYAVLNLALVLGIASLVVGLFWFIQMRSHALARHEDDLRRNTTRSQ